VQNPLKAVQSASQRSLTPWNYFKAIVLLALPRWFNPLHVCLKGGQVREFGTLKADKLDEIR
jgi:hypothetical protein